MSAGSGRPTVSVIVPTYNSASFVVDTITSIMSQTFTDFELIISDHASTDGTWEIVQQFRADPRVRIMRMPRTAEPPENWNNATAAASGRYLKLVCADDLLAPHCLDVQVGAMRSHPNAVMVASRRNVVTREGELVLRSWGLPGSCGELDGHVAVRKSVRSGTNIFGEPACVLLCRSTLSSVGGWDGRYPYVLDQYTYSKVLMHGTFVGIDEPLASFRLSDTQWSSALAREQLVQILGFHRAVASAYPGVLAPGDLRRGRWRAKALTLARRLTYLLLGPKLKCRRDTEAEFAGCQADPFYARADSEC